MSNEAATEHIEPEELADYFEGVLPEDRNNLIEEHFAECDQCTAQARQFRAFSSRWNGWTAKVHGEAYQRAVLAMALQAVERTHPHWRERLRQWQERWGGRAEAALSVIVERTEEASRVATESLEALVSPGTAPRNAGSRGSALRWMSGMIPGRTLIVLRSFPGSSPLGGTFGCGVGGAHAGRVGR